MAKKSRTVTLETVLERMDLINESHIMRFEKMDLRFEIMESVFQQHRKETLDDVLKREVAMEGRILKSVNDQVEVAIAMVQATTLNDLADKMEHIEFQIGQFREDSLYSSPNHSIDGFGAPHFYRKNETDEFKA
jgi:hypothetical protein